MCAARNKGSGGKVGDDFFSCARITQYCRDNIIFFYFFLSPLALEGPTDIMIAYIVGLQENCIFCQGEQHLTRGSTMYLFSYKNKMLQKQKKRKANMHITWPPVH